MRCLNGLGSSRASDGRLGRARPDARARAVRSPPHPGGGLERLSRDRHDARPGATRDHRGPRLAEPRRAPRRARPRPPELGDDRTSTHHPPSPHRRRRRPRGRRDPARSRRLPAGLPRAVTRAGDAGFSFLTSPARGLSGRPGVHLAASSNQSRVMPNLWTRCYEPEPAEKSTSGSNSKVQAAVPRPPMIAPATASP